MPGRIMKHEPTADISQLDAIVLAGGDSRRMGAAKATLPFGETSLVGAAR